jgi:hypothetical protein
MAKSDRFEVVLEEWDGASGATIFRDKVTGVNYLLIHGGNPDNGISGLTVLVDKDGKPVVTE